MTKADVHQFINGEISSGTGENLLEVIAPGTGTVVATGASSSTTDVDNAIAAARTAFPDWSRQTPSARALALHRLADRLEENADELVRIESEDAGKTQNQARNSELAFVIDNLRFFGGAARTMEGRAAGEYSSGMTSFVRREAVGVIGQVCPWNYPLMMAGWKIGPALAAGNTVVIKPAAETPRSLVLLAELAKGILPDGVLNVVVGGRDVGEYLVSHPGVDMVSITGSTASGVAVAHAAASGLKRAHLELGGNAPVIVHADADLDMAIPRIVRAGLFNAGQDCTAATRILVDSSIHDTFVARLVEAVAQVELGPLDSPTTTMGPLISKAQRDRVLAFLDQRAHTSTVEIGGVIPDMDGWYLTPAVVTGVAQHDPIVQEEIFGPVMTVQPFADEAEAISLANDVRQGLSASIWTRDLGRAMRASRDLQFGAVWVNAHGGLVSEMPHGGIKTSGYGRDLSVYGVEDYTELKHVMVRL